MGRKCSVESENVEVLHAAVEAFRKREIGYRDILEDLPAAIYTTDSDGRITYFNKACIKLAGRTPELGVERWCVASKLYTVSGSPLAQEDGPTAVAIRERRAIHGAEAIAERPDGSRVEIAAFPTPIFDAGGECLGAVSMLVDISEQKQAQERLALLAREVDHRSRNLLAVVQSLIRLTKAATANEYKSILEGRLMALARANSLIATARWTDVNLRSLVEEELAAFQTQVTIDGEPVELEPPEAQSFGMIVHELSTNAVKHGGLSASEGTIRIGWTRDGDKLVFCWEETGGPTAARPNRGSTGDAVIEAAASQFGGRITREWRVEGLCFSLQCRIRRQGS